MAKAKLTAGRVAAFECPPGKSQAFLWDSATPNFALRVTANGSKAYVFQALINGDEPRITIGNTKIWTLPLAQAEARRLKIICDKGQDPRDVKADQIAAEQAQRDAKQAEQTAADAQQVREAVTLGMIWPEYIADRQARWSEYHLADHRKMMQAAGEKRQRSSKPTVAGPLASLADVRLVDLTMERVEAWANEEVLLRPTRARLARRHLQACLNWCEEHRAYSGILTRNSAKSKRARETLGTAEPKNDVLQREQLPAWFAAVLEIENPTVSAYLQCLLLYGLRREVLARLRWEHVNFQWNSFTLENDKGISSRDLPLSPYIKHLLLNLKRLNETPPNARRFRRLANTGRVWEPSPWVFSSQTSASGYTEASNVAHTKACINASIVLTLHGLRRSFASLSKWIRMPDDMCATIQGHTPNDVRGRHYIRYSVDMLRPEHTKMEEWVLSEGKVTVEYDGKPANRNTTRLSYRPLAQRTAHKRASEAVG